MDSNYENNNSIGDEELYNEDIDEPNLHAVLNPHRDDPFNSGINSDGEEAKPKVVTAMGVAHAHTWQPPQLQV